MTKPRDLGASAVRVKAAEFRTPTRPTAISIFGYTFTAWVVSFFLFTYGTDPGLAQLAENGFVGLFFSWLFIVALISGGYALGYFAVRKFAQGQRPYQQNEVLRLALAESLAATAGGYAIGFFPLTLMDNMMTMMGWTFAVGMLFSFAVILPRYAASWRKAVAERRAVAD